MKVQSFKPLDGQLVVRESVIAGSSKAGLILEENTDDFLRVGQVVTSADVRFPVGSNVVYHMLNSESFRDGADLYALIEAANVKGTYADEENKEAGGADQVVQ